MKNSGWRRFAHLGLMDSEGALLFQILPATITICYFPVKQLSIFIMSTVLQIKTFRIFLSDFINLKYCSAVFLYRKCLLTLSDGYLISKVNLGLCNHRTHPHPLIEMVANGRWLFFS